MTSFEILSLIVSFLGFLVVAISVGLLTKQTLHLARQTEGLIDSLRLNSYQITAPMMLEVDKIFIDHPELRKFFYGSQAVSPQDDLYDRAAATAEALFDLFGTFIGQLGSSSEGKAEWDDYIITMFKTSPILREKIPEVRAWYPEHLFELSRVALSELGMCPSEDKERA